MYKKDMDNKHTGLSERYRCKFLRNGAAFPDNFLRSVGFQIVTRSVSLSFWAFISVQTGRPGTMVIGTGLIGMYVERFCDCIGGIGGRGGADTAGLVLPGGSSLHGLGKKSANGNRCNSGFRMADPSGNLPGVQPVSCAFRKGTILSPTCNQNTAWLKSSSVVFSSMDSKEADLG